MAQGVIVRPAQEDDQPAVLLIARELMAEGDTFAFDADLSDEGLLDYWTPKFRGQGYVAEVEGQVAAMFVVRPNQPGAGSHVANASFAVGAAYRGLGLGRTIGEAALRLAKEQGFLAMQFNIVVSTNHRAVALWKSLGFEIVGTVPHAFRDLDRNLVSIHIMHRVL